MNVSAEKTSSRAINSKIKSVRTTAAKYNNLVQEAIVLIIQHAQSYGDCTGAGRLVDAMPRSNRRQLVIDHFKDYSPIKVAKDKNGLFASTLRKPEANDYNDFNLDGVKANNWFERPEAATIPDVITFMSMRDGLNKFLEGMEKKAEQSADKDSIIAFARAVKSAASRIVTKDETLPAANLNEGVSERKAG